MKMPGTISENMIAPCGVNCFACYARFPKKKEPCPSCRAQNADNIRKSCLNCEIRRCANERALRFCAECEDFPCAKLKPLYKRYLSIHKIDLAQNGRDVVRDAATFLAKQREFYTCKHCGGIVNMHYNICSECGKEK
jgi:RNA polymerase subunit RPABC4/transcription elongation factor Spt4